MRINENCMRDILIYCADNLTYEKEPESSIAVNVNLQQLYDNFDKSYDEKDIMYSVMKLAEVGFIKISNVYPNDANYINRCRIMDITFRGHQFLDSIRPEPIWDKTKTVIGKVGVHTLNFIENVAHDIAVESGKEMVKCMMSK